jgi:lipopolysaccharide/colanic/teichoic acid biosynthesis glycosyltransferase
MHSAAEAQNGGGEVALELQHRSTLPADFGVPAAEKPAIGADAAHPAARVMKRTIDVGASVLLLLLLFPLLLCIALLIKVDSPGPILFRQIRIGRDGRPFAMLKFRTMIKDADLHKLRLMHLNETEGLFKIRFDPRITRVGRLLRSTSLDEMPQLLHVITGEMSLVGPRPLVPEEDAKIAEPFRVRSRMRPGMTGPWQVAGASKVPLDEMARLDCMYVYEWSLWDDVKILLMTFPHVLLRRGI